MSLRTMRWPLFILMWVAVWAAAGLAATIGCALLLGLFAGREWFYSRRQSARAGRKDRREIRKR